MIKKAQLIIYLSAGLFLILDRFFKFQSLHAWTTPNLINKYLGWQPYLNPGIGFGLPVPNALIIALTVPILILIGYLLVINNEQPYLPAGRLTINKRSKLVNNLTIQQFNHSTTSPFFNLYSLIFILAGALSNFADRVIYHHTVDYFLALTSLYNLADVMIIAGFVIYLFSLRTNGNSLS
jgi:lipoprotein signal peptidase